MEFSRELLFFFSALGAFNGLVLGLYFILFAKPKHHSNYFLGILLLTLSIRIGKSVFFYFNPELSEIFLQIGVSAVAFVGPSLYLYLGSITKPDFKNRSAIYHYPFVFIAVVTVGLIYPWQTNPHEWYYIFDAIYLEWLIYLLASGYLIRDQFMSLFKKGKKVTSSQVWILSIFIGNFLIWVAYNITNYTSYIIGALSFSFIFYLLILFVFLTKKTKGQFRRPTKYGDKKIDEEEAADLKKRLDSILTSEKLYKDPNLKLPDLAKELNIIPHRLSQLINDNMEKNFTLLINEYRIGRAKELIESDTHLKLESIGYECGFNSKSTFYSAFKKQTGTTPAKYQESLVRG